MSTRSRSRATGVPEKLRVRTFCTTVRSAMQSCAVAGRTGGAANPRRYIGPAR
jgi:hypothetical protein